MKGILLCLLTGCGLAGQVRVDNVLVRMVPPGTDSLVGAHMTELKATPLYQKLTAAQKVPELDRFAKETGFDPRTDVREMLLASTKQGLVLLARGKFQMKIDMKRPELAQHAKIRRHGDYTLYVLDGNDAQAEAGKKAPDAGFCILDSTLAAAGNVAVLEAALDEWKTGKHVSAEPLLALVKTTDPKSQVWGVSTGFAGFVADHMPRVTNGNVDFSKIFRDVENTWFQIDMSKGMLAYIHGTTSKEQDAVNLRDAAKGLIGFGRLSVPENQPELLRVWDGFSVEQSGRDFAVKADISQDLLDKLVQMMEMNSMGPRSRGGDRRQLPKDMKKM